MTLHSARRKSRLRAFGPQVFSIFETAEASAPGAMEGTNPSARRSQTISLNRSAPMARETSLGTLSCTNRTAVGETRPAIHGASFTASWDAARSTPLESGA